MTDFLSMRRSPSVVVDIASIMTEEGKVSLWTLVCIMSFASTLKKIKLVATKI